MTAAADSAVLEHDVPSTDETSETEVVEETIEEEAEVEETEEKEPEVEVEETEAAAVVDRTMGIEPEMWLASATPAYVEMVVRKREERGDLTAAQLKAYRSQLLEKHGLPKTAAERRQYDRVQAERKAARKAARKAEAKAAREARKLELAAQAVDAS